MQNEKREDYVARNAIMKLLSDDEVARVSTAETAVHLVDGDEYVDLQELHRGVRKALGTSSSPMSRVLPRKAVLEKTWQQIVTLLSAHHAEGSRSSAN